MAANEKLVLLVDDEVKLLDSIASRLELMGFSPLKATDGMEALRIAGDHPVDIAIVDLQMPDMNGLVTITKLKEIRPDIKTVLLTGHGNEKVKQATESLNTSYFEKDEMGDFWRFIRKLDADGRVVVIRPSGSSSASSSVGAGAHAGFPGGEIEVHSEHAFGGASQPAGVFASPNGRSGGSKLTRIIGETAPMQELRKNIERMAALDCTVIISGESGTGKELAARMVHGMSARKNRHFLPMDCSRFGNVKQLGQLLGAGGGNSRGPFGITSGGTLYFDRLEDMPLAMQRQLLAILSEPESDKAAGDGGTAPDIRIISGSRGNLKERIQAGSFLEALYWQLNLFALHIPPLRERKDDIPPLCSFFLNAYREEFQKQATFFSDEVLDAFVRYDFPGNDRELEHIIERAVILTDGQTIEMSHLPERFQQTAARTARSKTTAFQTLAEKEVQYIAEVLAAAKGNKSKTAEILGISRAALWRKLKLMKAEEEKN